MMSDSCEFDHQPPVNTNTLIQHFLMPRSNPLELKMSISRSSFHEVHSSVKKNTLLTLHQRLPG